MTIGITMGVLITGTVKTGFTTNPDGMTTTTTMTTRATGEIAPTMSILEETAINVTGTTILARKTRITLKEMKGGTAARKETELPTAKLISLQIRPTMTLFNLTSATATQLTPARAPPKAGRSSIEEPRHWCR